ncbi:MAG: RES domain-containing protein [Variovorax sp.]|nr:MAG: RES domain-containing protein [Variovorax sp.]
MSCRAPVPPLDALFDRWPAGEVIHVIHDTAFAPESVNPGADAAGLLRKPTRFAPIRDAKGKVVPYLYGGSTLDCAIFETVFHDVPVDAPDKFVDLDFFGQRGHGELVSSRDLRLVDLTSEGLHRLKVPKDELITSPARDYLATAKWAEALHHRFQDADGLVWMSRQRDRDRSVMLFRDRVKGVLSGARMGGPLVRNDTLRQTILAAALRAGIDAA